MELYTNILIYGWPVARVTGPVFLKKDLKMMTGLLFVISIFNLGN